MNERIKQLLKQASKLANTDDNKDFDRNFDMIVAEKFAELIVEEFRNVLADEYRKTPLECCGHFLRADETIVKHFYEVEDNLISNILAGANQQGDDDKAYSISTQEKYEKFVKNRNYSI